MKTKRSYGIVCFNNDGNSVLLIKKRYTYYYVQFLFTDYNIKNRGELIKLFSGLTANEKYLIATFDFDLMWTWLWRTNDFKKGSRLHRLYRNKFYNLYKSKIYKSKLYNLLNNTPCSKTIWEIPKGKRKLKEKSLTCAIREFEEETGLTPEHYNIISTNLYTITNIANGKRYSLQYYPAIASSGKHPSLNYNSVGQISELCDVRYVDIEKLKKKDNLLYENIIKIKVKYNI